MTPLSETRDYGNPLLVPMIGVAYVLYAAGVIAFVLHNCFDQNSWLNSIYSDVYTQKAPVFGVRFLVCLTALAIVFPGILAKQIARRIAPGRGLDLALDKIGGDRTSWARILAVSAIPLILSGAVFAAMVALETSNLSSQTIASIDADSNAFPPAKTVRFAQVKGTLVRDEALTRNIGAYVDTFMPVVGSGWTPGRPIHYFVHYQGRNFPAELSKRGACQFAGKIAGRLPSSALAIYGKDNLQIDPSYVLLNWMEPSKMPSGPPVADYDPAYNVLGMGLIFTGVTFGWLFLSRNGRKSSAVTA